MERWYIGSGWTYKFEGKMFDIRGKNSGVYNFSSEKKRKSTGHYSRMVRSTGGGIFL